MEKLLAILTVGIITLAILALTVFSKPNMPAQTDPAAFTWKGWLVKSDKDYCLQSVYPQ